MAKKKYIETPEILWQLFQDYAKTVKSKPILVHDFVGKDADEVRREKERPLTLDGFENYVADIPGMPLDLGDYFENRNDKYTDFSAICSRIKKVIRQDQIEGGMAGIYNPSITQRLNGLVEKQSIQHEVEQPLFKLEG